MNIFQRYKNYSQKEYNKHINWYEFKPHFNWNPFDTENTWVYRINKWRDFLYGWIGVGYAWEAWTCWMRDLCYSYKLPDAFWLELNEGWNQINKKYKNQNAQ